MNDESIVQSAQARASISGYLSQNPGDHPTSEVSAAVSISPQVCGQFLRHMAKENLIIRSKRGSKMLYAWPPEGNQVVMTMDTEAKKKNPPKETKKAAPPKDVELVLNGTLIVLGRNPVTGRLRITLEDTA